MRYEVVSLFTGVKRPFARPAKFSNKKVAIAHARKHGNTAFVFDVKSGRKVKIFERALTYPNH